MLGLMSIDAVYEKAEMTEVGWSRRMRNMHAFQQSEGRHFVMGFFHTSATKDWFDLLYVDESGWVNHRAELRYRSAA